MFQKNLISNFFISLPYIKFSPADTVHKFNNPQSTGETLFLKLETFKNVNCIETKNTLYQSSKTFSPVADNLKPYCYSLHYIKKRMTPPVLRMGLIGLKPL